MASTVKWLVGLRLLAVATGGALVLGYFAVRFGLDGRLVPAVVSGTAAVGAAGAGWWYLRRTLDGAE